jgi:uncharacterized membrane protein YcaP (DUF421 family)
MDPTRVVEEVLGLSLKAENIQFWQVAARAVWVYIALIAMLRLAKKRSLGRATALDVVLVITVGSLASRGITGNAPLTNCLIAILTLIGMHWLISLLTRDHARISDWIKGTPTRMILNGKVDQDALLAAHMSDDDLMQDLRQKGVTSPEHAEEAILERSGQLSVLKKNE